jgi:hypothetical protein
MHTGLWLGRLKEGDYIEERYKWEDNIKMYIKWNGSTWTGFIWLGIGTSNGVL